MILFCFKRVVEVVLLHLIKSSERFVIETTNVFLENATQVQRSPSATLESTSAFTVTTMSNKTESSSLSTTATTQSKTSSKTTGVAKTSVTSNLKLVHCM